MLEESEVRDAIRSLIGRKEAHIKQLRLDLKDVSKEKQPIWHRVCREDIRCLDHSIFTLIELAHNLRLCDCPDEAYEGKIPVLLKEVQA